MRALPLLLLTTAVLSALSACGKEKVVATTCRLDDDCQPGYLCENYECVPREAKQCEVVLDGNPILQPAPHAVDFGTVDSQAALLQTVTLHNIGNCTLTLFEASLKDPAAGFTCDLCSTPFPKEIWPGRSLALTVGYTPGAVQASSTELVLLSDDKEYPTLRVPVRATYVGTPQLVASPDPVDFGYTAEGRFTRKAVQLTNQGTGTAPITVTAVQLSPADTQDFALIAPMTLPKTLVPLTVDGTALLPLEVRYTPRSLAAHTADLLVTTNKGSFTVPLQGTSATPPRVSANPTSIDLGDVTLGTSTFRTLTLVNEGGAPLTIKPVWGAMGFTTDFYTTPQVVPAVAPTQFVELQVAVTATREGELQAILNLETNDPLRPTVSIPVRARGVLGQGAEVVKLEMTYENGSDSAFDKDLRDVDMTLEHPYGYVCNEQTPSPMNWGAWGTCSWLAFAPKEEPERIILADARQDGTYRVMLSYQQDCASIPTELLAGLLGISVDVLVDYLSGGAIPIPGQDIGRLIQNVCLSRDGSAATVKVYVNGTLVAERQLTLGTKGDSAYVLNLVRANGAFSVQ